MEDFCTLIISCKLNEDDYKTLVQDKYHANINKLRTIANSIEDKDSFEVERLQTFLKSSITFPIEKETFDDQCFICDDSSWQTRGVRFFQQSFEHADHHYHLRSFPAQPDETFVSVFEDELNPYFYANKLPTLPDRPNSRYLKPNPNSFKLSISETIVAHKKKEKNE